MHETPASEEEDTRDFTLRETERLKFITERSVGAGEEGDKKKEKDKKGGGEEHETEEAADESKEEEITPQQQLYNHYLKVKHLQIEDLKILNAFFSESWRTKYLSRWDSGKPRLSRPGNPP